MQPRLLPERPPRANSGTYPVTLANARSRFYLRERKTNTVADGGLTAYLS
jgi:hypothetical protein